MSCQKNSCWQRTCTCTTRSIVAVLCYVLLRLCFVFPLHHDVIRWKHFPRYWPSVRFIHRSPVNSPHKGQWRGAVMFSLIRAWSNGWVSNRDAADLRRHRTHYDVTVMEKSCTYVFQGCFNGTGTIDQSHKSHNPPFRTEICTFLFWMVHCGIQAISGICELGQLHHCANTCKATWENMYELCEQ